MENLVIIKSSTSYNYDLLPAGLIVIEKIKNDDRRWIEVYKEEANQIYMFLRSIFCNKTLEYLDEYLEREIKKEGG